VRHVHHHAEPLHLVDDAPADVREPAVAAVVARGAADRARDRPRERQVAGAPRVEDAEVIDELVVGSREQRVPALDAEERRDETALGVGADLRRAPRPGDRARVGADHRVDRVELLQGLREVPFGAGPPRTDEDREELGVEPAGAHLRKVHLHVRLRRREVDAPVRDPLRAVGVGVDDDGSAGEPWRARPEDEQCAADGGFHR